MTQFAVRIGSILLMCFAATPLVAGPRGGASFGGDGAHFGAGARAFAAPLFRGRFAQFSSRHHQHFLPIITVGFIGPLFWPYAYNDFLNYTFYPYAYDAFWPGAYDDVYDGITDLYGSRIGPGYVGTGGLLQPPSTEVSSSLCAAQTARLTDWRM